MSSEPTEAAEAAPVEAVERSTEAGASDVGALDEDLVFGEAPTVEALAAELAAVRAERDTYLDDSRRLAAEFANFRKQMERRHHDLVEQANTRLVEKLLPTLDACEAAAVHGATAVEPVLAALFAVLEREGLARVSPDQEPFDPAHHEAVIHEPAEDSDQAVVTEVLRTGYILNGRVVRPALVKVKG